MKITTPRQLIELLGAMQVINSALESGATKEDICKLTSPEALIIAIGRMAEADKLPEEFMVQTLKLAANIINAYKGE